MRGWLGWMGSLMVAVPLAAQMPASGAFVATLGHDTVAVESFARMGNRITGTSAVAYPRATLRTYTINFGTDGALQRFAFSSGTPGAAPTSRVTWEYRGDSTYITARRDTAARHYAVLTSGGRPYPFFEDLFLPWDLSLRAEVRSDADSGTMAVIAGPMVAEFTWHRESSGRIGFAWSEWGSGHVQFDAAGAMTLLDLTGTTNKYIVRRVANVNVEQMAARWEKRPQPGQLSPRDTARIEVAGAHVLIDYGRPSLRGRVMFGKLLPWGKIWRLGANAATQLITDKDLVIGADTIPAGTYSLWSVLTPTTWELIVNKQHGQWGTEYHADSDFVHIPLTVSRLSTPLEQFTTTLEPKGADRGAIRFAWEGREGSVAFRVKE